MPPRAIFFDMDDTLLDTSGAGELAWNVACHEFGPKLGFEADALRAAIRREAMEFWRDEAVVGKWRVNLVGAREHVVTLALTAEGLDASLAPAIAERFHDEATSHMQLFDDALHTLETLRGAGYKLALITNGPAELQLGKIAKTGIEPYFDAIVIEGVFGKGKPEPEVFAHALAATGTDAPDAWHIGDNLYADVGGAQAMGIHAVWIHRGRLKLRDDLGTAPDRIIGHLSELHEALDGGAVPTAAATA